MALFDELVAEGLEAAEKVCGQRGAEYGDSYAHNRCVTLNAVKQARKSAIADQTSQQWDLAEELAAMVDIKFCRLEGGYKDDTLLDLINYVAALKAHMLRLSHAK